MNETMWIVLACIAGVGVLAALHLVVWRARLALTTREALIDELLARPTFRGVVVFQKCDFDGSINDAWHWQARHCDAREVCEGMVTRLSPAPEPPCRADLPSAVIEPKARNNGKKARRKR